jgi:hypothetical protein
VRRRSLSTIVTVVAVLGAGAGQTSAVTERIVSFLSPSRNIACILASQTSARCDIKAHTWRVGKPKGCIDLNYGDSLSVGLHGRGFVTCHGDTTFDRYRVLAYGHSVGAGPFTCSMASSGVTCSNRRTRHGFLLSRARIRLF